MQLILLHALMPHFIYYMALREDFNFIVALQTSLRNKKLFFMVDFMKYFFVAIHLQFDDLNLFTHYENISFKNQRRIMFD